MKEKIFSIIVLILLVISFVFAENGYHDYGDYDYDSDDSYSYSDFYTSSDPNQWNYDKVDWDKVDFSRQDVYESDDFYENIPDDRYSDLDYTQVDYSKITDHSKIDSGVYLSQRGYPDSTIERGGQDITFSKDGITHPKGGFVSISGNHYPPGTLFMATEERIVVVLAESVAGLEIPTTDQVVVDTNGQDSYLADGTKINGKVSSQNGVAYVETGDKAVVNDVEITASYGKVYVYFDGQEHTGDYVSFGEKNVVIQGSNFDVVFNDGNDYFSVNSDENDRLVIRPLNNGKISITNRDDQDLAPSVVVTGSADEYEWAQIKNGKHQLTISQNSGLSSGAFQALNNDFGSVPLMLDLSSEGQENPYQNVYLLDDGNNLVTASHNLLEGCPHPVIVTSDGVIKSPVYLAMMGLDLYKTEFNPEEYYVDETTTNMDLGIGTWVALDNNYDNQKIANSLQSKLDSYDDNFESLDSLYDINQKYNNERVASEIDDRLKEIHIFDTQSLHGAIDFYGKYQNAELKSKIESAINGWSDVGTSYSDFMKFAQLYDTDPNIKNLNREMSNMVAQLDLNGILKEMGVDKPSGKFTSTGLSGDDRIIMESIVRYSPNIQDLTGFLERSGYNLAGIEYNSDGKRVWTTQDYDYAYTGEAYRALATWQFYHNFDLYFGDTSSGMLYDTLEVGISGNIEYSIVQDVLSDTAKFNMVWNAVNTDVIERMEGNPTVDGIVANVERQIKTYAEIRNKVVVDKDNTRFYAFVHRFEPEGYQKDAEGRWTDTPQRIVDSGLLSKDIVEYTHDSDLKKQYLSTISDPFVQNSFIMTRNHGDSERQHFAGLLSGWWYRPSRIMDALSSGMDTVISYRDIGDSLLERYDKSSNLGDSNLIYIGSCGSTDFTENLYAYVSTGLANKGVDPRSVNWPTIISTADRGNFGYSYVTSPGDLIAKELSKDGKVTYHDLMEINEQVEKEGMYNPTLWVSTVRDGEPYSIYDGRFQPIN